MRYIRGVKSLKIILEAFKIHGFEMKAVID